MIKPQLKPVPPRDFWRERVNEGAVLSPIDRISEVLFGLIMVLTFTGAISAATNGREEIRDLLWAALGCNVAWGLVDAIMFLMNNMIERGHYVQALKNIKKSSDAETSREILKEELQPVVAALMTDAQLDQLTDKLRELPTPSSKHLLGWKDMAAGIQIFMLVFLCTLPVALPFAIFQEISFAMRVSNGVALLQLFIGGYLLARYAGFRKVLTAGVYAIIGVLLVSITMALGG
jgi:hypothetical protein